MNQRKNKESRRAATPSISSIKIAGHSSKSKFMFPTDDCVYFASFVTLPINAYLKGETYSMNLVHFAMLPEFLKYPEKRTIGKTTIGITVLTDLASTIIEPKRSPAELPAKTKRKSMK